MSSLKKSAIVKLNGNPLYYEDHGQGPPVVFIHGAFNTCEMWRPQIDELSRRHRVIVYDLRGHGRSGPTRLGFSIGNLARDLDRLLDHLSAAPAVVCGFSLGGCVAQEYAARYPGRVKGLIVSDSIGDSLARPAPGMARALFRFTSPFVSRRRFLDLADFATRPMQRDVQRYFLDVAGRNLARMTRAEIREIATSLVDFRRQDLSRFDRPALVIAGAREPRRILNEARQLATRIPGAAFRIIDSAQHGPNRENAPVFNAAVEELLDAVETAERRAA